MNPMSVDSFASPHPLPDANPVGVCICGPWHCLPTRRPGGSIWSLWCLFSWNVAPMDCGADRVRHYGRWIKAQPPSRRPRNPNRGTSVTDEVSRAGQPTDLKRSSIFSLVKPQSWPAALASRRFRDVLACWLRMNRSGTIRITANPIR